ncbi:hypothetical protein [Mammaliicoccus sp. P-M59]|uniref:hypothetical protein n=1 Tax=Mammaliicoccus sp. P-M59 TaxID=2898718 RepID=UPI001EFBA558|nr:hypothetical protein [Mammaliicoccus sp. P-M59]
MAITSVNNINYVDFAKVNSIQMKQGDKTPIAIKLQQVNTSIRRDAELSEQETTATIYLSDMKTRKVIYRDEFEVKLGTVTLVINSVLPVGSYNLEIDYNGKKYPSDNSFNIVINHSATVASEDIIKLDNLEIIEGKILDRVDEALTGETIKNMVNNTINENVMDILDDGYKEQLNQEVINHFSSNIEQYRGERGLQGIQGERGQDGKNAYELAKENGYMGSLSEWIDSLKGQKGDAGEINVKDSGKIPLVLSNGAVDNKQSYNDITHYRVIEIGNIKQVIVYGNVKNLTDAISSHIGDLPSNIAPTKTIRTFGGIDLTTREVVTAQVLLTGKLVLFKQSLFKPEYPVEFNFSYFI